MMSAYKQPQTWPSLLLNGNQSVMRLTLHISRAKWTSITQVIAQILLSTNMTPMNLFFPYTLGTTDTLYKHMTLTKTQLRKSIFHTERHKSRKEKPWGFLFAMTSKIGARILTQFMSQCWQSRKHTTTFNV